MSGAVAAAATSAAATPLTAEERRQRCLLAAERRTAPGPCAENDEQRTATVVTDNTTATVLTEATTDATTTAEEAVEMDMDPVVEDDDDDAIHHNTDVPEYLTRVLAAEKRAAAACSSSSSSSSASSSSSSAVELLVMAVHALFLEAGLALASEGSVDEGVLPTRAGARNYALPAGWCAEAATRGRYRLRYTLGGEGGHASGVFCTVTAQPVGHGHLVIVGSMDVGGAAGGGGGGGDVIHRFNVAVANYVASIPVTVNSTTPATSAEASTAVVANDRTTGFTLINVRRLWAEGKDALATRLKTALCLAAGVPEPPALLTLPDELKICCFARLSSAVDLATLSCVSAELRYLAASDDLWRPLYVEEFGERGGGSSAGTTGTVGTRGGGGEDHVGVVNGYGSERGFKRLYAKRVRERRAAREARRRWQEEQERRWREQILPAPSPQPHPLGGFFGGMPGYTPGITGGDYDLYPGGLGGGMGTGGRGPAMPGFPGGSGRGGGLGGPGGGFGGGGHWPTMPGGMPGGLPTPTPGSGRGSGWRGGGLGPFPGRGGRGGRGGGFPPVPGWDGRPRPPDFDGDII